MSREEQLLESAREASGDRTIFDVGVVHPRGLAAAAGLASAAGNAAGDAVGGTVGGLVGGAGGVMAGIAGAEAVRGVPARTCIALSPTHIHLLGMNQSGWDAWPITKIEREGARVDAHARAMNRILVIEDGASGHRWELEAPRLNPYHTSDLIDELAGPAPAADVTAQVEPA